MSLVAGDGSPSVAKALEVEEVFASPTESTAVDPPDLGRAIGHGLAWSLLNNFVGRLGNFLSGIIVVRILSQAEFGTYAVGMVVLAVLLSVNELGVSVAVIQRRGSVDDIAPTVMTMSIASSLILSIGTFFAAPIIASMMNSPEATWLIRLLVISVLVDGICAVPNALISRALQQRKRLVIDTVAFFVGTPITIALAIAGYGAWSLGWGALVGNITTGLLGFLWAPARYRPGWRKDVVPELLRFGLPLAGASLLLFLLLNVDYIVVGHQLGAAELGFYLLAFNLCSWPITVVASAIRRVTLTAFARMREGQLDGGREGFALVFGLAIALILPGCALLSIYADQAISILYGERWLPAAEALQLLVVFSAGRVAVELAYDFLAANGRTSSTIWLHATWLAALFPALILGAHIDGIRGVAAGHALVVVVVLVPVLAIILRREGVSLRSLARHCIRPLLGVGAMALVGVAFARLDIVPIAHLLLGGAVATLAYFGVTWPMRRSARSLWNLSS